MCVCVVEEEGGREEGRRRRRECRTKNKNPTQKKKRCGEKRLTSSLEISKSSVGIRNNDPEDDHAGKVATSPWIPRHMLLRGTRFMINLCTSCPISISPLETPNIPLRRGLPSTWYRSASALAPQIPASTKPSHTASQSIISDHYPRKLGILHCLPVQQKAFKVLNIMEAAFPHNLTNRDATYFSGYS